MAPTMVDSQSSKDHSHYITNSSRLTNTKLQQRDGHGVILTISHLNRRNGSWIEDVLGRRSRLELEMLSYGILGVCTTEPLPRVIDQGSLPVSLLLRLLIWAKLIYRRLLQARWSYQSRILRLEEGSHEEPLVYFPRSPPFQAYWKCFPRPRR